MAFTGLTALGVNYFVVRSHFEREEQEEIASITRSLKLTIDHLSNTQELQALDSLTQSYADLPDVIGVAVVDGRGQVLALNAHTKADHPSILTKSGLLSLIQPTLETHTETYSTVEIYNRPVLVHTLPFHHSLFNQTEQSGFIIVAIELEEMRHSSWTFLLISSAMMLIVMLVLLAKVGIFIRVSVLKPLQLVTQAIEASKDSHSFNLPSNLLNNEFHFLAATFDSVFQAQQQAEQTLQERETKLRNQNQILSRLAQYRDINYSNLQTVIQEIMETAAQVLGVERVSVWLYDEAKTKLDCYDLFEKTPQRHSAELSLSIADYPTYFQAVSTAENSIVAHNAHTDPRTCGFADTYLTPLGIQSMLDTAIRLDGQTIGIFCIEHTHTIREWQPEDEGFARSIADIVALAIEACDRKRAEIALLESETTNRALVQAIPDLLIRMKRDGTYVNIQNVGNITLINPEKALVGNNVFDILPREIAEERMKQVEQALQTSQLQVCEQQLNLNGTPQYEEVRIMPCGDNDVLVMVRDISDRQRAENQIRRQAKELARALQKLKITQAQIVQSEKMSSLGQMVAGVAHEINNPVNFIYGNVNYASEYTHDLLSLVDLYQQHYPVPDPAIQAKINAIDLEFIVEDLSKVLSSMRLGAERIRAIVHSLRNFSRLDEAEFKAANIHEGIDSTLMILHNRLTPKPGYPAIQITKQYGEIPYIDCYPGQLNQVFMNIISNAVDALDEYYQQHTLEQIKARPGYIHISTELVNSQQIAIRIADNGLGMNEQVQMKLFDPFFTTKPVGKGSGLGLSVSYQIIVEKHKGKLSCDSAPGQGSEFVIELPICQESNDPSQSDLAIAL
ncbi:MAG: ATP-binding protein [Oculatellaceae cyanobacterium bins.114]|nr:ATP-binding protein [Oculatellaceae cyanobacterium bins.114]